MVLWRFGHWLNIGFMIKRVTESSLIRYLLIGASAFAVDFGLLNLGLYLHLHLLAANGVAATVAIIYSFILHRSFSFAHLARGAGYQLKQHQQFMRFVVVSVIAVGFNEALMAYFVNHLGLKPNPAKIITSLILLVWNYTANRLVTFQPKSTP
jgi:putative flippase GtrA